MSLKSYRRKRNFEQTAEPRGSRDRRRGNEKERVFVVQKHDASSLHYDFRLELDGVLKSWAVPKGPSLDPGEKRLAVHVEDHPLEYGSFEGTIPAGEYGAGTVLLWDRGTWAPLENTAPQTAYEQGKLKLRLAGEKLSGGWNLVRMGGKRGGNGKNWLLIKENDDAARRGKRDNLLKRAPESVKTGRSLDDIAEASDSVWRDERAAQPPAPKKSAARRTERAAGDTAAAGTRDPGKLPQTREAGVPRSFWPELATLVKSAPTGDDWLHEIKFDGYRILARRNGKRVHLLTRRGKDWTSKFPEIAAALEALGVERFIIDGEICAVRPDGLTSFQDLQNALRRKERTNLALFAFDLPHCGEYDLTETPLLERKTLLSKLLDVKQLDHQRVRYSNHVQGDGPDVHAEACRLGTEGIISKRAASTYQQRRTRDWVKVKCLLRQEFVIGGYTDPGGARKGFGALLLGYYADGDFIYCGRVGTGFDDELLEKLGQQLQNHERKTPPFENPPEGRAARSVHWVTPRLVGEVEFTEWTADGYLRHPSFQGLREDKAPEDVHREQPVGGQAVSTETSSSSNGSSRQQRKRGGTDEPRVAGVRLTSPDRVLYPDQGITKRALAEFYAEIADWVLPHVTERPLALVRCPEGRKKECFFQKHFRESMPDQLEAVSVPEKKGKADYVMIRDLAGLIALVQMGVLEIHPWGSRADRPDRPDLITFDLDPGENVSWADVVAAARHVHARLNEYELTNFLKTSGGKGLHVIVPITRRSSWDEVRSFASRVAHEIAEADPERFVATMSKAKRKGKVFIDYLRNGQGATSVAAYSTRARTGAPVSTPLRWDELSPDVQADAYTVETLPQRLSRLKSDPWQDFNDVRQAIRKSMLED